MSELLASYTEGTYRLCRPAETLARIRPLLHACGITRCADVTQLEADLGVPTCCAIRPGASVLATSNGKGLTKESAQVSALMEAVELYHAEVPEPGRLRQASRAQLLRQGLACTPPAELPGFLDRHYSDELQLEWVEGEELGSGSRSWAPASAIYAFRDPSLYRGSTNGLASGNHVVEATLHALYEVLERDAISRLVVDGRLAIKALCLVLDPATVEDERLRRIMQATAAARSKLVLLWVPSAVAVHTFWAFLVNQDPVSAAATVNPGCGTHHDATVAATRAVTEAVQSRLTSIHGAREDILDKPAYGAEGVHHTRAFRYLTELAPTHAWCDIPLPTTPAKPDLAEALEKLVADLTRAGHPAFRFDLTKPGIDIPVVKVIAPTLRFDERLF